MLAVAGSAALGAAAAGVRSPARAAAFSYKLANDQPASHPMTAMSLQAAEKVRIASQGELEIHVFPNGILGGDPQLVAQTRSGAIELLQIGNNVLASTVPSAALEGIPFAFMSAAQLMAVANGPLGAYIGAAAAAIGLRRFTGSWYGGAFQVENGVRPIAAPSDLKGLKIRVPPGPVDVATFKAFDALPTSVILAEVYTALQTHLVDGIEVPLATVENFKFYELVKYVSITNHSHLNYLMLANADAWSALPARLQAIVDREFNAAAVAASTAMAAAQATSETTLRSRGLAFNRPPIEPFRRIIREAGLYQQWRDAYDPAAWAILEKAIGKLT
jgi:TRAP-type transport system periplasmic protein